MSFPRFKHRVVEGEIWIEGDAESLRLFAAQILELADMPRDVKGAHAHFDEAHFSEPGSTPLIVIRHQE